MRDVLGSLRSWYGEGRPLALATVVGTSRSAPRAPGAAMAVSADGEVAGSVSGGCVEGAVYELAQDVLGGEPPVLQTYGYSDSDAFAVGLTCGGSVSVFVQAVDPATLPQLGEVFASIDADEPVALATVVAGDGSLGARLAVWPDRVAGTLGTTGLDAAVTDDARGMLEHGATGQRHYGPGGERRRDEVTVFVEAYAPPPRMLVFGAIDFAAAVARIGKFIGYRVSVCDARAVFATARRFPDADEVVVEWPHRYLARTPVDERTVICVLTHDPKFDVPLLEVALRTPAWYVGAMGSRRTHDDRLARLREIGLTDAELARLRSPIGLDLGARTPEETAVAVAAEIVAGRWGGSGLPLGATSGEIHRHAAPAPGGGPAGHGPAGHGPVGGGPVTGGQVAGVVLAAGAGSRMGRPKALIPYAGQLLVERACRLLADGGCDPVLAVLGAAADEVLGTADLPGVRTVRNPHWETGMGSSLRVGLAALPATATAVVVTLVDTPLLGPDAVRRLAAAGRDGAAAALATYGGVPGHPVLLAREVFAAVASAATGDRGARAWLTAHPERVRLVPCDGTGDPRDLDVPDDLAAVSAGEE